MNLSINRQRRIVTLLRWVMFIALAYLTTADDTSYLQLGLLAVVAASNIALSRVSDKLWEHAALLPVIAGLDTVVLVGAMLLGQGFARDFFFVYFANLAIVALAGNLRGAIVGTGAVVASYGTIMVLQYGQAFLQSTELIGRLSFLFTVGIGYGGMLDASRIRMREAALQKQLMNWVGKLSAAFSDDFDAREIIRQVLVDTQAAYPGNTRASLVQIEDRTVSVISSSSSDADGTFELAPERYPELIAAVSTGELIVIDDLRTDPITESVREFVAELPFNALLLCPVELESRDFGHVILRIARKGSPFTPSMVATTRHVAKAIGVIFRQAKLREAVERSEKMEMVSQVTRSVANSFNGILSTVLLSSQALRKGARQHDEVARCGMSPCGEDAAGRFDSIDMAAKEGLTIVERLGAWTRLGGETGSMTRTSLPAKVLFEEAWVYASPVWGKRVQTRPLELQWQCADEVPNVLGNSAELREVILNLILNAIDAMPKGGILTLGVKADGDAVVFSVQDTGTGIDPDIIDQIFDPMFSTKGSAGTGLGLSLARSVAERHGGSLDVESTDRVGSCFRLRIPMATELLAADSPGRVDHPDNPSPAAGARLLLVEPSDLVRDVMVRALQGSGFDVDVVSDLEEAKVMLGARSGYAGLIADAAADRPRAEGFLEHVQEHHGELQGRMIFYSNGVLPAAMRELQSTFGFTCLDRSVGLAGLRVALAELSAHREAA